MRKQQWGHRFARRRSVLLTRAAGVLVASVLLCQLFACRGPADEELAGIWSMDGGSRRNLPPELRGTKARLILLDDGRFRAQELPLDFGGSSVFTGSGTWTVTRESWTTRVQLSFSRIDGEEDSFLTRLLVARGLTDSKLRYYWGDADLGRRIDYVRDDASD